MSNLISGKEAKLAWANGDVIQFARRTNLLTWEDIGCLHELAIFDSDAVVLRLKPRTITLNGVEVPAPFEPKDGDDCRCYCINHSLEIRYDWYHCSHHSAGRIVWRTEEEIKQVVEALQSVFKGGAK